MYKKILVFFLLLMPFAAFAQQSIKGKVYTSGNRPSPLPEVNVKNLRTNETTKSSVFGEFNLPAKAGDLLAFSYTGYHTDTLFLLDLAAKSVYMLVNANELNEVKVVGARVNPLVFGPDPQAQPFKRIATDGLRGKGNNDRAGGLSFNLGYGKYRRQEEKIRMLEERDKYEREISEIFTEGYVANLINLKGEDLKDFMALYRPTAALVKSDRPFNYDYYIVQAYHKWIKLPQWQRKLPPVPKLKGN